MNSLFEYKKEYADHEHLFEDNQEPWLEVHKDTRSVLDHPNHVAKYVIANMHCLQDKIPADKLNSTLSHLSVQELIETYQIEEYTQNFI